MPTLRHTLTALALAGLAGLANAASVHIHFDAPIFNGVPAPHADHVKIVFPPVSRGGSGWRNTIATRFQGTASDIVGVDEKIFFENIDDVFMYSYQVDEDIGNGWDVDYTIDLDGASKRTREFLGAVNAVLSKDPSAVDTYAWLKPTSAYMAAAIQLGIWESLYDDSGWDLASGDFRASGMKKDTADWLAAFLGRTGTAAPLESEYVMTLKAPGAQDMITGDPPPAGAPEPGTIALVAAGAAALVVRRRRAGRSG